MIGEVIEEDMKRAADYLAAVAERPPLTGIASTTEVCYGFPAQQVMGTAESHGSDLIVLCQQEASVPIEPMRPFSTLVPLDGSELAEAARTRVNT